MDYERLLNASEREIDAILTQTQEITRQHFGNRIYFYAPSFIYYRTQHYCSSPNAFPSISITGSSCALKCKHCDGIVLGTMYPANSPEKLLDVCEKLKLNGAHGCLISGGCLPDGSVPLENFTDAMSEIKQKLGLTLLVHTGIVTERLANQLRQARVDAALIDIVGSNDTIKEIYNLNLTVADYDRSLAVLKAAGVPTVPHVLVGLHYGRLKGELNALRIVTKYKPTAVIIIAFMPIHKTVMEQVAPPQPLTIGKIVAVARMMMPSTPLALGCMRPRGLHRTETDVYAIRAGVNAIAFPAEEAVKFADSLGYKATFSSSCCSQMYQELRNLGSSL